MELKKNIKLTYIVSGIRRAVFFENTAVELIKKGYELDFILVGNLSNDFEIYLQANGINYTHIQVNRWTSYPHCVKEICKVLKKNKPDIVHTHLTTANVLGLTAAKIAGVKCRVFTEHTGQIINPDLKTKFYNYVILKFAVYAVAISAQVKKSLVNQKFKESNIKVIHHGFNIDRFRQNDEMQVALLKAKYNPGKKYPVIGLISRVVERKGIQYAIPAFKKLLVNYPNALLCLFSFSEGEGYSRRINEKLGDLPDDSYIKIEFENNVYDLYQLFDIFIHIPTDRFYEAFGQTYIESLASGIPSVFTISGIANEFIVNNENALVVKHKNSEEVYLAIKELLTDKALVERLVQNGRTSVTNSFGFDVYMTNLDNFYKQIFTKGL